MTFIIVLLLLGGLALVFAGIENQDIGSYVRSWL